MHTFKIATKLDMNTLKDHDNVKQMFKDFKNEINLHNARELTQNDIDLIKQSLSRDNEDMYQDNIKYLMLNAFQNTQYGTLDVSKLTDSFYEVLSLYKDSIHMLVDEQTDNGLTDFEYFALVVNLIDMQEEICENSQTDEFVDSVYESDWDAFKADGVKIANCIKDQSKKSIDMSKIKDEILYLLLSRMDITYDFINEPYDITQAIKYDDFVYLYGPETAELFEYFQQASEALFEYEINNG